MDSRVVTLSEAGGVARITLNRPAVMNALNAELRVDLLAALRSVRGHARVIVLTGAGRAFSSGQDLSDVGSLDAAGMERVLAEEYEPLLIALGECPVPVIAAVNGVAAGAGASLALACDLVIAAESAQFVQAFSRIGLIPDAGATFWLPRLLGPARAMGAALLGQAIPARQAVDWGMIWDAVPDAEFGARVDALAEKMASGPTQAYRATKQALRAAWGNDFSAQLALEARLQADCGATDDFREGVAAFLEKRPARFTGR